MRAFAVSVASVAMWALAAQTPLIAQTEDQRATLAAKLVGDVLHVKAGDAIVITADASETTLVDDIALRLREVGAFAIADVSSNRAKKLYYELVPEQYDSQQPKDLLGLASIATAFVNIAYPYDRSINDGVSPARLLALRDAATPYAEYLLKHNIPVINVGNGIFPSPGNAARFGISEDALSSLFWGGVNTDYAQVHRDAVQISRIADGAHAVHITAPNGTDFRFRTVSGSAVMNDGSISDANLRTGGAALEKQLPGGDVYVLPEPGSANGVIVFGTAPFRTGNLVGMTLRFTDGKMTSMRAISGGEPVQAAYASASAGRDEFAWADFGVNRSMHLPPGIWGAGPSMVAGYVTAGLGNNLPQGGSDRSSLALSSNIPDATVTVDGKTIIAAGRLAI
jgi:leucyl aminopeptidase (aminopeptidase T)